MGLGLGNYVYWSSYSAPEPDASPALLDAYPGAAAAYSLRQLSSTYSGDAIRVRRSSDNAEQNIGFVSNELDTASLETFCSGTDGFVRTWYDQSGNSGAATQLNVSTQPQIVSNGTYLGYILNNPQSSTNFAAYLMTDFEYTPLRPFSSFIVVQSTGHAVIGGTSSTDYYANAWPPGAGGAINTYNGFGWIYDQPPPPDYYSNGSSVNNTPNDLWNATSSFAELTTLATKTSSGSRYAALGYTYGVQYNNMRLKEYIIYDNQTISRTGVEDNIITHYGF